jgi:hypothetical protein
MERAMAEMAHELEGIDETEDPRRMGHLMRRFSELSGLDMGPEMEALMERLEAGDDPDEVESEIERLEEAEDPAAGVFRQLGSGPTRRRAPRIDEELHFF